MQKFYCNGNETYGIATLYAEQGTALYVSCFGRQKYKVKAALASWCEGKKFKFGYEIFYEDSNRKGRMWTKVVYQDHSKYYYGEAYSAILTQKNAPYIVTTLLHREEDFYNYLMNNFSLPLKKEWAEQLLNIAINKRWFRNAQGSYMASDRDTLIYLNNEWVKISDVCIYQVNVTEELLESAITEAIQLKMISVTDQPAMDIEPNTMDDYILKYKKALWSNICDKITPLVHVRTDEIYANHVVFKSKRLFEKQQERVMGAVKSLQKVVSYALLNEGMGVGKTIQSLATIEEYFNSKYCRQHPKADLRECFKPGAVRYRNIIIAPAHLTKKWAKEIVKEVPGARAIILNDFSQLITLREEGEERCGKDYYLIGKDFCKLGTADAPVPYQIRHKAVSFPVCRNCKDNDNKLVFKKANRHCPVCHSADSVPEKMQYVMTALVCPECGELLLRPTSALDYGMCAEDVEKYLLRPRHFASRTNDNSACFHCGARLWSTSVKNMTYGRTPKTPKWYKIKHFANCAKKSTTTAFVLRGHEYDYLSAKTIKDDTLENGGYEVVKAEYGPRRVAPSQFIKRYLKGYFDFAILDEVHKFEGEGTAQSNAAQALVAASSRALGLTGTISNGTATCIFSLLWLLEPQRMKERGWSRTSEDILRFARTYGTVETIYEVGKHNPYNKASRGRVIQAPRVRPGISPRLLLDFLIDRAVFLDITDLGASLPPLNEFIELVDQPQDVAHSYSHLMDSLKSCLRSHEGAGARSNILQMGLSYSDKPYFRAPIKSTTIEDVILAVPDSHEQYATDCLLPKEERMVEIIRSEIEEDRNVFVYCSYTGAGEANIINRLGDVIERHCNLSGRVCVINSTSPAPLKREEYIQKQAAKGIRVFLINPKCCETGLDFCFDYEGTWYNYPTLIFFQPTYELAVLWQASRRHYRACQTKECRTYWLAYRNTLQATALEIMASKQVAVSAIQGKFSSEGLASMAKGINAQEKLTQALLNDDMSSDEKLTDLFGKINKANTYKEDAEDEFVFHEAILYSEMMGVGAEEEIDFFSLAMQEAETGAAVVDEQVVTKETDKPTIVDDPYSLFGFVNPFVPKTEKKPVIKRKKTTICEDAQWSLF